VNQDKSIEDNDRMRLPRAEALLWLLTSDSARGSVRPAARLVSRSPETHEVKRCHDWRGRRFGRTQRHE
jgi:hypothetical protein